MRIRTAVGSLSLLCFSVLAACDAGESSQNKDTTTDGAGASQASGMGGTSTVATVSQAGSGGAPASSTAAQVTVAASTAASTAAATTAVSSTVASTSAVASSSSASSSSTGGGTGGCMDSSSAKGTLTGATGFQALPSNGGKSYLVWANWWNVYTNQTEPYSGLGFTVQNPQNSSSSNNNPMGFPSLFIGSYAGHATTFSNLPKQVSALTTVPTIFKTNSSSVGLHDHNSTYDVWFTSTATPLGGGTSSPGAGGAYLMVWEFKPDNRQPVGGMTAGGQTVAGVTGNWDVWIGNNSDGLPVVSYVRTQEADDLDFDLNDFIKDAVSHGHGVNNNQYLSVIFAGFEIWGGNNGLAVTQFCAKVN